MARRWGRKSAQIPLAEKVELVERWLAREPLDSIARDYGVSPGMVSTIAIQEFGHPPQRLSKARKAAEDVEAMVREVAPAMVLEAMEPAMDLEASPIGSTAPAAPAPDVAALVEELKAARRELAEMRREVSARLAAFELAMVRFAAKKAKRRADPTPQLSWPFGH
jgi:N12 class adenine-specific DNA methylase